MRDANNNSNSRNSNTTRENTNMNTRENRMETLSNAGVDTSRYFDATSSNTTEENLTNNQDEILAQIMEDGYVKNTKLHRRWVMAQMFRMLNWDMSRYFNGGKGYDDYLRRYYDYNYQFKMMLEEVRVLSILEDKDRESFEERSHFFNREVVGKICSVYVNELKSYVNNSRKYKCKGAFYVNVHKRQIFVDDLQQRLYAPLEVRVRRIKNAKNYKELYQKLLSFNLIRTKLPYHTPKNDAWIEAFKGNGAYYTLMNLVKFHNCNIHTEDGVLSGTEAVNYIKSYLDEYKNKGHKYMDMLQKCIDDNNFDFRQRMEEIYG